MRYLLGLAGLLVFGCSSGGRVGTDGGGLGNHLGGDDLAGILTSGDGLAQQTGTIYAHDANTLYTVDPTTFDLTTVGAFGVADDMTDLAVTPDGHIYTISRTALYEVNAQTAQATVVQTGIATSNVALTFQVDGTLLASDQSGAVRVIDPQTGTVTELGSYGSGFDTAGDLVAVSDGTMFGISDKGAGSSSTSNVLITVDTKTAQGTGVGGIGFDNVFGIAYAGGRVLAFTTAGEIIRIDPKTGQGTLVKTHPGVKFWGAGTSPLVPIQ